MREQFIAKAALHITCCAQRMIFGSTTRNMMSRFIKELPKETYELDDKTVSRNLLEDVRPQRTQKSAASVSRRLGAGMPARKADSASYSEGERVEHPVYGAGTVLSVKPMGGDRLLEIAFDSVGTKKVMANYAKLKKPAEV